MRAYVTVTSNSEAVGLERTEPPVLQERQERAVVIGIRDDSSNPGDAVFMGPERSNDEMFDFLVGTVIAGVERRLASLSATS